MEGFLSVLKVPGPTSHDVVQGVRRLTQARAGHLGTLDPLAAGVLPVAVGAATRFIRYVSGGTKRYRCEVLFGRATDTGDLEGKVMAQGDAGHLEASQVAAAMATFRGEQQQQPPAASAIKVDGVRMHQHFRRGVQPDVPSRTVTFHDVVLVRFLGGPQARALVDLTVSAGTYVRSFAEDLGGALEVPATVSMLLRTRSGPFTLEASKTLEEIARQPDCLPVGRLVAASLGAEVLLPPEEARRFRQGAAVSGVRPDGLTAVRDDRGGFLGVGAWADGRLVPKTVRSESGAAQ